MSAENVQDSEGRQYHLGLAPGELAPSILLVGDPQRAELVAGRLERVDVERRNREYVSFTGLHDGLPLSVIGTGIGADNTEIAVIELSQCVDSPTLIRCGSCGGLQPDVRTGDVVISEAAYRLENTSLSFVGEGYPAAAHPEVTLALLQAVDGLGHPHHVGMTASAPGFYGAQDRHIPPFSVREPTILEELQRQGVKNIEMEMSCLFSLASLSGMRAGGVCAVYANRHDDVLIQQTKKSEAEARCIETALAAFHNLAAMDEQRGARPRWHPGLS